MRRLAWLINEDGSNNNRHQESSKYDSSIAF